MKSLRKKLTLSAATAVVALGTISVPVWADSADYNLTGWQFNPGLGKANFDNDTGLDDDNFLYLGLEYMFESGMALEGSYLQGDAESSAGAGTDFSQYRLDGLYYFKRGEQLQPYLSGGFGRMSLDPDGGTEFRENLSNVGLGMKYYLTQRLSLRGDVRYFDGRDTKENTTMITATLSYFLDGPPAKKPVAEPVDSDKDGLADADDRCPDSAYGARVDATGCEIIEVVAKPIESLEDLEESIETGGAAEATISLDVKFASNQSKLSADHLPEIKLLAGFMKRHPGTRVSLEGYTDNRGDAGYNKMLSQKRAEHIMQLLVQRYGVDAGSLSAVGYGEVNPIADNETAAGRRANRRVTASIDAGGN